ncbi:MAG TPA: heat-inducible transcriptional repressor HrcA [Kofleriaceae bacterium]|nr:heat-inducible transcriptional repressor HrcA [Kofleriaceae bacterium]
MNESRPLSDDDAVAGLADLGLSHRARKILRAVISEYLQTGAAVGSRTITRRRGIELSPATVRNVMADLEDMGLLSQPHTSAGRVPTQHGLRFFIDSLLRIRGLSPKEKEHIRLELLAETPTGIDQVLGRASRMLSAITHYAGIVLTPNPDLRKLRHIELLPLSTGRYVCVLVTTDGHIENRLVEVDVPVDDTQLERIHNYLTELLSGLTLAEVRDRVARELADERAQVDAMVAAALKIGGAAVGRASSSADVVVSGKANLLDIERIDDEEKLLRLRNLVSALEDKEVMVELLDRTMAGEGMRVFLGAETALAPLEDSSVVAMPYGPDERPLGAIAVVGPTRMNYGKIMSVVDFTAELMTRLIADASAQ